MNLTHKDYVAIIEHYGEKVPHKRTRKNNSSKPKLVPDRERTRKIAEDMLANKMCKCIKSVQKSFERRTRKNRRELAKRNKRTNRNKTAKNNRINGEGAAIGICRKNIFTRRGIDFNRFACKKRAELLKTFKNKQALQKSRKNIF